MSGLTGAGTTIPGGYVRGASTLTNANRLTLVSSARTIGESNIAEGSITGVLTITKTGTTARTVTFQDAAHTVAGLEIAQTFTLKQRIDLGSGAHPANAEKGTTLFLSAADAGTVSLAGACYGNANGLLFQAVSIGGSRASPAVTGNGYNFFNQIGYGHDGNNVTGAKISYVMQAPSVWSATSNETHHVWAGTPASSTTLANWMWLNNGLLGIGAAPTVGNGLLQLASGTTKANGIAFGTDVFLYRSAADTLTCDDKVAVADTTDATSSSAASVVLAGGLATAASKAIFCGGRVMEQGTFAEIHVHDASAAQTIATGATYTKSTAFTDNGASSNCTADAANDKITLTKTGYYRVEGSVSFTTNTNNVVVKAAAFLGGTEQDNVHCERKVGTSSDIGNMGFTGFIDNTSANTDLDLRLAHDYGSDITVTIKYANLNVTYLGET